MNKELNSNQAQWQIIPWETEAGGSSVQTQPSLHMEFQISLVYMKPPTQNITKNNASGLNVVDHVCNPNTQEVEAEFNCHEFKTMGLIPSTAETE